ncbi:MAG: hypothetical protein QGF06_03000 [Acidimicrobiales bacterium]|jgi:hypothetical protein|nr:hypothetical protein [Acidimicrobiales bacterium]MDP6894307.1 hypothetical protein [Acidimicrobiales bacterium]HJM37710.1 hypothetical protein [Acidimicrobiales bacterium]|tara:strand:- start:1622 stop:2674 length:1053 start_codon:yes stop_codon:yes gene_type:complete
MGKNVGMETQSPFLELPDEDPDTIYELFEKHGWGDGLPLVAPTDQRVTEMLSSIEFSPEEVIAVLPPRGGSATYRSVAVNAVMAGCKPEYFPVVVAAVKALGNQKINLRGVNTTTHPVAPLLIVHGEAVEKLGFNSGLGVFGPGNRANATVGRAVRLVLLHVAGAVPGPGDASTQGQPSKYTYCIAENQKENPWESYPVTLGVDSESSLTVHCGENPHNFHDMESENIERILDKAASAMTTFGVNNACISGGEWFVILCPEHAATAFSQGWGREDVSSYLFERARMPAGRFREQFNLLAWADWMNSLSDDELVPMTQQVENIKVLVSGGAGKHSCVVPSWGMTRSVTVPI